MTLKLFRISGIVRAAGTLVTSILLAVPCQVWALHFEPAEELTIDLDTTVSYGAMWRVEKQDHLGLDDFSADPLIKPFVNAADDMHESRVLQWNSDDGDRNFEKGDLVSNRTGLLSDFDMRYKNFGVFLRGQMFYDSVYFEETSWDGEGWDTWVGAAAVLDCDGNGLPDTSDPYVPSEGCNPAGQTTIFNGIGTYAGPESINNVVAARDVSDPSHFSDDAKERHGYDARFLDAYIYGTFEFGDRTLDLRLGRQAINWGEAIMLQGGIGFAQNRIDAAAATSPGVQLKEIFLPSDNLYGQLNLTDSLTVEAYWQYTYQESELFAPGAYFSTTDFLGANDGIFLMNTQFAANCMFGFETFNGADINGVGGSASCTTNPPVAPLMGIEHWLANFVNAQYQVDTKDPDDPRDQYGLAFRKLFDGGSEAGVYFVQYHDKYPSVWAANNGAVDTMEFARNPLINPGWVGPAQDSSDAVGFNMTKYTIEHKERIKLYGLTYNTVFGDIQMGFELTYRENQPVVPACSEEALTNLTFDESIPDPGPGNFYGQWAKAMTLQSDCKDASLKYWIANPGTWDFATNAYATPQKAEEVANRLFAWPAEAEVFTYNIGVTAVVPPTPLWDTGIFVAEFGGFEVGSGYTDDDLKVTDIAGFTQSGYGMSAIFLPQYKNIIEGVDLTIPVFVNLGLEGSFAYFNYQEDSVWWSIGAEAVYLSNLTAGINYSSFHGDSMWHDRDNVSVNVKYSF